MGKRVRQKAGYRERERERDRFCFRYAINPDRPDGRPDDDHSLDRVHATFVVSHRYNDGCSFRVVTIDKVTRFKTPLRICVRGLRSLNKQKEVVETSRFIIS